MIKVKEVVGISTYENKKNGKIGTTIHYIEPFDVGADNVLGMMAGSMFTYLEQAQELKIGDKFKAYYDSMTFNGESKPVLAEIVKCSK